MNFAARLRASIGILALQLASMGALADEGPKTTPVSLQAMLAQADELAPRMLVARAEVKRGQAAVDGASVVLRRNLAAGHRRDRGSLKARVQSTSQSGWRSPSRSRASGSNAGRQRQSFKDLTAKELQETRWLVHREVHAAFHTALVARERWDVVKKLLVSTEELLSVAERRLQAGDISPLQVRLAEGELAQARQKALTTERGYRSAQLALAELSGWPPDPLPEPVGDLDEPRRAPPIKDLLSLALQEHPGIAARATAVEEAEARVRLENREAWPEPTLGVTYTREALPNVRIHEHIVQGTIALPIPLSQRNQQGRAQRSGRSRRTASRATGVRAGPSGTSYPGGHGSRCRRESHCGVRHRNSASVRRELMLLRRAFELGEVDLLQVLVARERLLIIQQDALTAHQDYYRDVAALEAEVGTEVWPDEHHEHGDDAGGHDDE